MSVANLSVSFTTNVVPSSALREEVTVRERDDKTNVRGERKLGRMASEGISESQ